MRPSARDALLVALLVVTLLAPAGAAPARSPFEWRAVVEGPYGAPWDHGQRTRAVKWMPAHGFNAYVHAPKDDLWQRTLWREPYPAGLQAQFDAEIRLARARRVEWIPNLSPALPLIPTAAAPPGPPSRDLCFSCPADLDTVVAKLEPFRHAGSRTFMISFDDVTKAFGHPEDVVAYGAGDEAFGRANGDFLTRLLAALRARAPGARLLTVGADYSGTADTAYLRGLRTTLHPDVGVMWTGNSIPSQEFTREDARAYGERIGRRPLVWDNWTNNDTAGNATPAGTARIFLGPYRRRADVAGSVGGFFFNPMNEADLNLLPLATAGDWMRDPGRFRRRSSWLRAVRELAGRDRKRRSVLRAWGEASYSHKLDPQDAPTFARRSRRFLDRYRAGPGWASAYSGLRSELVLARDAAGALAGMRNRAFAVEARPFLDAAREAAGAGVLGTDLLAAERPSLSVRRAKSGAFSGRALAPRAARAADLRSRYRDGAAAAKRNPRFVYGWRGGTAFEIPPYPVPRNLMDEYFDAVDALDRDWSPRAGAAESGVTVALAGRPVPLGAGGTFRLPRSACGKPLVATDAAGGQTGAQVPRCRRR